ncbi:hypothetical protein [Escherichia phage AV124]|nr:hypothetical protein [Escherichia phage AV124]
MDTGGKPPEVPAIPVMRITLNNDSNVKIRKELFTAIPAYIIIYLVGQTNENNLTR